MGTQASQELDRWASVADLARISRGMRLITMLPAECQVEVLRHMWRSLRWVPRATDLLSPDAPSDSLLVIVRGEAQAVLGHSRACELWPLLRQQRLPSGVLRLIDEFLSAPIDGPRFHARVRTTRPSLVASLSRGLFLASLRKAADPSAVPPFNKLDAACNALQNITAIGVAGAGVRLAAADLAALRVVCEGPMNLSCAVVGPSLRRAPALLCGSCTARPEVFEGI